MVEIGQKRSCNWTIEERKNHLLYNKMQLVSDESLSEYYEVPLQKGKDVVSRVIMGILTLGTSNMIFT